MLDFAFSAEEEAFRAEVRAFLARELPSDWPQIARHGPGSREQTEFSLSFCPKLASAGLLLPHWPREYWGREASAWQQLVLAEEMWAVGEPRGAQYMNVNWIGPTLLRYGSAAQKACYIPQMAAGKAIWCQGFSEPGAGSDLASLRTRAERVGGDYILNGQKIWTSYASLAEHCFLLARVSGEGVALSGKSAIAIFLVPMDSPGIEVRAIPSLIGHGDIHEVFFTDVRVPAEQRLGAEGAAWEIISYSLANERVGLPRYHLAEVVLVQMVASLQAEGRFAAASTRHRAAEAQAACAIARQLVYRVIDAKAEGRDPGSEGNLARKAVIAAEHAVADFANDFLPEALTGAGAPEILAHHERAIVAGIASGAAEIQLNLIATRHLGLPR